ncbi:MAG TPA: ArsA-related P-loop ATPase [Kofleriaceae bacterium]
MSDLLDKRVVLVLGKGGVGRSTVAASIAAATARRGRRTLLFEASANDRFGELFGGTEAVGSSVTRLRENLYAVNTNPSAALEEYGLMVLKFRRVYKMVFENRVTRYFLRAIPGLDEYAVLGKAWYHWNEEERGKRTWDTLVFDMPASGHAMSMLRIPKVILETVPEGPLTRDAATLRKQLQDTSHTAIVVTTLAEEMPVTEARELTAVLHRQLNLRVARLIVNQVFPERFPHGSPAEQVLERLEGASGDLAALAGHGWSAMRRRRLNERYITELARHLTLPRLELPLLFAPRLGPAEVDQLSRLIENA